MLQIKFKIYTYKIQIKLNIYKIIIHYPNSLFNPIVHANLFQICSLYVVIKNRVWDPKSHDPSSKFQSIF